MLAEDRHDGRQGQQTSNCDDDREGCESLHRDLNERAFKRLTRFDPISFEEHLCAGRLRGQENKRDCWLR